MTLCLSYTLGMEFNLESHCVQGWMPCHFNIVYIVWPSSWAKLYHESGNPIGIHRRQSPVLF